MTPSPPTIAWSPQGTLEVLTFNLGPETMAIEATLVREILDPLPRTEVPGADAQVPAVINFRGQVIPLADLRVGFGMATDDDTHGDMGHDARIVVAELDVAGEPVLIGFATQKVNEVATLSQAAAQPPPALGLAWPRHLLRAIVRHADAVILLPDLTALFAHITAHHQADAPALA